MKRTIANNKFATGGVFCSADSFVLNESAVICVNNCGEKLALLNLQTNFRNVSTMKIIIVIISFGLFFSCNSKNPEIKSNDHELNFLNIENINSISILFDNSIVKDNQIIWPLGYQDIYEFTNELSIDGFCHTTVDTIIKLDNKYFVILRTDLYEKNVKADCHICCPDIGIASFEKNQNGFKLINFKKHVFQVGGFGEYGTIAIDTLCNPVIKVSSGWTGTGAMIGYDNYYDINDFSFIYSLQSFSSNGGIYDENEANYEEIRKTIINKSESSFIVETIIVNNGSLNKRHIEKYAERVSLYDNNGSVNLETERLKN